MKKGFTMIELIFVIVILGILASVAVPRLAGTKADAEISAAVANLRTLISDANVYYVAKGGFAAGTSTTGATSISTTWSQITNVPVSNPSNALGTSTSLKVGGTRCIDFLITKKNGNTPAYFTFTKNSTNGTGSSVCAEVLKSPSLDPYFKSKVPGGPSDTSKGYVAIGSNIKLER